MTPPISCAQWFTSKKDYFIRGAPEVILKSDAKNLDGLLRTELGKIENPRLQRMVEKMMPYNLKVEHVRGVDNNVADFGSRYPRDTQEGEEFEILRPTICTKSRRVQEIQFDSVDPKVEKLARIASECPDYQMVIHHISRETPMKEIEDNSELKRMQGGLKDLAVYQAENGHSLIIRHGKEILIPVSERK